MRRLLTQNLIPITLRRGVGISVGLLMLLIVACRTESDVGTGPTQTQPPDRSGVVLDSLTRAVAGQVSIDSLLTTVSVLSGEISFKDGDSTFTVRSRYATDRSHALAIRYIALRLQSLGFTPVQQAFGTNGTNILAVQTGTVEPDHVVLIGAHYDSMPLDTISPGADDNASGVAATLEAARILSKVQTRRSIIFAFWDQEERGLLGSKAYADQARSAGKMIEGVINVDMIGYDGDADMKMEVHVNGTAASNVVADSMIHANTVCATPINLVVIDPGTQASDHASFWRNSYGAVLIIEEYFGHDFNPNYHSRYDRIGLFSQPFFASASRLAAATAFRLAGPATTSGGLTRR